VERAAAGFGIIDRYSHILHIDPIQPIASKEGRAGEVCYLFNNGSVQLPESVPWLDSYLKELSGFPLAPLADKVDATVHALKFVVSGNEFRNQESTQIVEYDCLEQELLTGGHDGPSAGFKVGGEDW
jgi:phage terminase large subunit-like protein